MTTSFHSLLLGTLIVTHPQLVNLILLLSNLWIFKMFSAVTKLGRSVGQRQMSSTARPGSKQVAFLPEVLAATAISTVAGGLWYMVR